MASHHHCHHNATTNHPTSAVCNCCSCYPTPPPPPPNPHSTHACIHFPPPPQPHFCASHLNPQPHNYETLHQNHHYFHEISYQQPIIPEQQQTRRLVSSLLRRIDALESSLRRRSSPSISGHSRQSLRDAAARTIQSHFRAFLARRSKTLRQLKQLASIKTTLNIIKSSVSGKTHIDTVAITHRAMDLLVRLDSIRGVDPLIRDGKRSISNELTHFMEVINGVSGYSSSTVKNVRYGNTSNKSRVFSGDRIMPNLDKAIHKFMATVNDYESENEEPKDTRFSETDKSRGGGLAGSHGGLKAKPKKSVSFAENGNAYRVFKSSLKPASRGDFYGQERVDAEIERLENLSREVEEIGLSSKDMEDDDEAQTEDGESSERSDEIENESFLFSAPLPVKMEGRADVINRRKAV